ncbi:helix-turn-helix domain-containing protein [Spirosoma rhododendri]|uniref:Helix-turn-helix transcriptional regulator n=1 Tax=Spirosoma rhododendri TaxID=2728024 RepID=A0A7L5DYY1_9BACT|nr:helix-turn-helix transcriptional regulator [Spirosoma rhododendri]QJD80710.1 helix-turn-helix transcriptional regulator [Spirosoma rhododendri]
MKKDDDSPLRMNSLTEVHRAFGLPKPAHPLISLLNGTVAQIDPGRLPKAHVLGFYKISYKPRLGGRLKYGQSYYDFDEGGLLFASPGQIIGSNDNDASVCSEYTLLIHPDFLLGYPLAKTIRQYGFFSYATNETLHLSDAEKTAIMGVFGMIETELTSRIDEFSQDVVISQIELLMNYANRFYNRQFITRKAVSHELLQKLDDLLDRYFTDNTSASQGLPTVGYLAEHVNLSPSYLSDMLRAQIGQNAQQYIHNKLIERAKEQLSTTNVSVGEVSFALGFEHSQSFSKFFKTKTNLSPLEFRRSFN